jgi:hypothetical protein
VRLRREQFETQARQLGFESQSAQARAIGVHQTIHHRAIHGARELSGSYVIGVLLLVGDEQVRKQIADIFDVADNLAKAS